MKLRKVLYNLIIVLLLVLFAISGFCVVRYYLDAGEQMERYDHLASLVEQARQEVPDAPAAAETVPGETQPEETEPSMLPEYAELYDLNSDLAGWLTVEGTRINYPVMQTPEDPNYYLTHNFDRETNAHGCLYAWAEADLDTPSDNVTIFGHHMKDGSMFADLKQYTSESFYTEHSTFTFDTLTERHTYQIFAVFKTTADTESGFAYHQFVDAADAAEFDAFVARCKALSFYDTGVTPVYGDKLLCLSTCEYTRANGRLVVAALRISE